MTINDVQALKMSQKSTLRREFSKILEIKKKVGAKSELKSTW